MRIHKVEDGIQIEVPAGQAALLTIVPHIDFGFKGSLVSKDINGNMRIVHFHGDGVAGTDVEAPVPFPSKEEHYVP